MAYKIVNRGKAVVTVRTVGNAKTIVLAPGKEYKFPGELTPKEVESYTGMKAVDIYLVRTNDKRVPVDQPEEHETHYGSTEGEKESAETPVEEPAEEKESSTEETEQSVEETQEVDYDALTKAQLTELCKEKGAEVTGKETKAQLIAKLRG